MAARKAAAGKTAAHKSATHRRGATGHGATGQDASSRRSSGTGAHRAPRRWSAGVTEHSDAMDLDPGVFKRSNPHSIALSLKRSADRSQRRKSEPFRSAMSMLSFYINRAGRSLSAVQRRRLQAAKDELRALYHRT
jgi:Protein of unknown function (DUF3175)